MTVVVADQVFDGAELGSGLRRIVIEGERIARIEPLGDDRAPVTLPERLPLA